MIIWAVIAWPLAIATGFWIVNQRSKKMNQERVDSYRSWFNKNPSQS